MNQLLDKNSSLQSMLEQIELRFRYTVTLTDLLSFRTAFPKFGPKLSGWVVVVVVVVVCVCVCVCVGGGGGSYSTCVSASEWLTKRRGGGWGRCEWVRARVRESTSAFDREW